jgi:hypothetical protein
VRLDAAQVACDQDVGYDRGIIGRNAHFGEDRRDEVLQAAFG